MITNFLYFFDFFEFFECAHPLIITIIFFLICLSISPIKPKIQI